MARYSKTIMSATFFGNNSRVVTVFPSGASNIDFKYPERVRSSVWDIKLVMINKGNLENPDYRFRVLAGPMDKLKYVSPPVKRLGTAIETYKAQYKALHDNPSSQLFSRNDDVIPENKFMESTKPGKWVEEAKDYIGNVEQALKNEAAVRRANDEYDKIDKQIVNNPKWYDLRPEERHALQISREKAGEVLHEAKERKVINKPSNPSARWPTKPEIKAFGERLSRTDVKIS